MAVRSRWMISLMHYNIASEKKEVLFMENAPTIILFWFLCIVIVMIAIALMITAIILLKKGKGQRTKKMQFLGKLCLILSILCSIPIILVVGYILYLYIG